MYHIVSEWIVADKYNLLQTDTKVVEGDCAAVVIDGTAYKILPTFDVPGVGIESNKSFVGKDFEILSREQFAEWNAKTA